MAAAGAGGSGSHSAAGSWLWRGRSTGAGAPVAAEPVGRRLPSRSRGKFGRQKDYLAGCERPLRKNRVCPQLPLPASGSGASYLPSAHPRAPRQLLSATGGNRQFLPSLLSQRHPHVSGHLNTPVPPRSLPVGERHWSPSPRASTHTADASPPSPVPSFSSRGGGWGWKRFP